MRLLALILVLLATAKVAAVQWLHRSASDDVIITAYRPRALDACSRDARRLALGVDPAAWTAPTSVRLEVGKRTTGIHIWQVDNPGWAQHYRTPYLVVTAGAAGQSARCAYDLVAGTAAAARL